MQTPAAHVPHAAWFVYDGPPAEKEPAAQAFARPLVWAEAQK